MEITILMPCLDEEETLEKCILKALKSITAHGLDAEVLIADNGSTDNSISIADRLGARIVHVEKKGYGNTLKQGIVHSKGKYVIMGDSDDSYDFSNILPFIARLRDGDDLVMGNRFAGGIKQNAMPFIHRYLGNPVLSFIGRLFYNVPIRDFHCGLRGVNKSSMLSLNLSTPGMEFASEMIVKSAINNMKISEVPTVLHRDGRSRPPHLNTWRDGWRHLMFLFIHSPKWLFLYPGLVLFFFGLFSGTALVFGPFKLGQVNFDIGSLLYSSSIIIIGFQCISFYLFSCVVANSFYLTSRQNDGLSKMLDYILKLGVLVGCLFFLAGIMLSVYSLLYWEKKYYGDLNPNYVFRLIIPAVTALVLGGQIIFNSFFLGILHSNKND